jgi:Tol biopolymer transport system component
MNSRKSFFVAAVGFTVVVLVSTLMMAEPGFSDWSAPVNLGPVVNSVFGDAAPTVSKNGRSLYFHSNRPSGGFGTADIWVSQRNTEEDPWGPPINLGPVINTTAGEFQPALSRDGHWLFFQSSRPGSAGLDIWVSYREHIHDDLSWLPAVNAGPGVNSPAAEGDPSFFENDDVGVPQLFFTRANDIYVSDLLPDGTFGLARSVPELNTAANEIGISVRFDGLEAFVVSNRPGSLGIDVWTATRPTVLDPWSVPTNLALVNSVAEDLWPDIASDRETLYFMSNRAGGFGVFDLYVTTRTKKKP